MAGCCAGSLRLFVGWLDLVEKSSHPAVNLVGVASNLGKRSPSRVREVPVEITACLDGRARVTAAQRDDTVKLTLRRALRVLSVPIG
jgi:hypothetical protein